MIAAIARRLRDLEPSVNRDGMAVVLARARRAGGRGDEQTAPPRRDGGADKTVDWLERVMAAPDPDQRDWRDLASILGLSRLLVHIGTTEAAREVAAIYPRFGELFRIDVERQMLAFGERAVPVLIEQKRGESKEVRAFALALLEMLGKSLPGEAVQTADNGVLGDVLRAYGRVRDRDAASVIVAFANSDRAAVREAARDAVALLGEAGGAQLRESYENLIGQKSPPDWGWEKVAGELFRAYDRSRLAEVYVLMDEGLAAYARHDLDATVSAFDRVLARAPTFEHRQEMAPAYIDAARPLARTDRPRALSLLRRALHVDPSGPRAREASSQIVFLEALDLASRGIVDQGAYRRALELNPDNAEAKEEMVRIEGASKARGATFVRYVLLAAMVMSAIVGVLLVLFWRGRRSRR